MEKHLAPQKGMFLNICAAAQLHLEIAEAF